MKIPSLPMLGLLLALPTAAAFAQRGGSSGAGGNANAGHDEMLAKLGITTPLRPGPAG